MRAMGKLDAAGRQVLREGVLSSLFFFIENSISIEERLEILLSGNSDVAIQLLENKLSKFTIEAVKEIYQTSAISIAQKLELIFISSIELILYSITGDRISQYALLSNLDFPRFASIDVFMKLSGDLEGEVELPASLKFEIFKNRVGERNLSGWLVKKNGFGTVDADREYKRDHVLIKEDYRRQFVQFFKLNPEFSARSLFQIQSESVLFGSTEKPDDGFDQYYHCRRAVDSQYLISKLEKVLAEIDPGEIFENIEFESGPELD